MKGEKIFAGIGCEMLFEQTIRLFLGDEAFHIAAHVRNDALRKKWYRKVLKKAIEKIQQIESTSTHEKALEQWSGRALEALSQRPYSETVFANCILGLVGTMLGYFGPRPSRIVTPAYFQTESQYLTEDRIEGGDGSRLWYEENNVFSIREKLVEKLKSENKTHFEISLILNISEYKVKKIIREIRSEHNRSHDSDMTTT